MHPTCARTQAYLHVPNAGWHYTDQRKQMHNAGHISMRWSSASAAQQLAWGTHCRKRFSWQRFAVPSPGPRPRRNRTDATWAHRTTTDKCSYTAWAVAAREYHLPATPEQLINEGQLAGRQLQTSHHEGNPTMHTPSHTNWVIVDFDGLSLR